jgi:hypothetical protein
MATEDEIKALKRRYSRELFAHPEVNGVGVDRDDNGEFCLTVHLSSDVPDLPAELEGHAVRYVRRGPYSKQ